MKMFQKRVGTFIAVMLLGAATYAAIVSAHDHSKNYHIAQLNAMLVAINNVNQSLLPNHFEMQGKGVRYINGYPVELLNGKLRASRNSLKQGLDSAYHAVETNTSALRGWRVIEMQSAGHHSRSLKVFPKTASDNCFLVYTEAGTVANPKPVTLDEITHGC